MLYLRVVMWCYAATWSASQDQSSLVPPHCQGWPWHRKWHNLDLLNSELSVQSSQFCLVLLIDWTGQDRTNSPVPPMHYSSNKTSQLDCSSPARHQLQHSFSTGPGCRTDLIIHRSPVRHSETVANQLDDKTRHKNSKSAWHGTVSLSSVGSLIVK